MRPVVFITRVRTRVQSKPHTVSRNQNRVEARVRVVSEDSLRL